MKTETKTEMFSKIEIK